MQDSDHNAWPHGKPRNDRVAALQAGSQVPLHAQIWKHEQRQRVEDAVSRLHQAYVSDARGSYLPPDSDPDPQTEYRFTGGAPAAIARHTEQVPLHTPQGWMQDMTAWSRRATHRIQQEYVDEVRQEAHFMDQLRQRSRIQENLDEEKRQRERPRVRQEIVHPVQRDDIPNRARIQPGPGDIPPRAHPDPDPGDTPLWSSWVYVPPTLTCKPRCH